MHVATVINPPCFQQNRDIPYNDSKNNQIQEYGSQPKISPVLSNHGEEEHGNLAAKYDSSVPILDYKAAPFPKRTKLTPKKPKISIIVPEDGEILE